MEIKQRIELRDGWNYRVDEGSWSSKQVSKTNEEWSPNGMCDSFAIFISSKVGTGEMQVLDMMSVRRVSMNRKDDYATNFHFITETKISRTGNQNHPCTNLFICWKSQEAMDIILKHRFGAV